MPVNTRTLLIIVGLVLPVIVLGILTFYMKENNTVNVTAFSSDAIANARNAIEAEKKFHQARLAEIEKYTDATWQEDAAKHPHHAPNPESGIKYQKNALNHLDSMTPQQWIIGHKQDEIRRERWEEWRKAHPPKQTVPNKPLPAVNR